MQKQDQIKQQRKMNDDVNSHHPVLENIIQLVTKHIVDKEWVDPNA